VTYTLEALHRMDPAAIISYENHRPMTVVEVIMHICHDDWPAETSTQKSETASHQEPQA
jgi:hypothetical protein